MFWPSFQGRPILRPPFFASTDLLPTSQNTRSCVRGFLHRRSAVSVGSSSRADSMRPNLGDFFHPKTSVGLWFLTHDVAKCQEFVTGLFVKTVRCKKMSGYFLNPGWSCFFLYPVSYIVQYWSLFNVQLRRNGLIKSYRKMEVSLSFTCF